MFSSNKYCLHCTDTVGWAVSLQKSTPNGSLYKTFMDPAKFTVNIRITHVVVRHRADIDTLEHLLLWLDLQPADIKSRWRHNWKSAQVVNSHLVCDLTIRQLGFDLRRQQWSLLNRFRTEHGQCGACRRKWRLTDTDPCPCGETQTNCPTLSNPVLSRS